MFRYGCVYGCMMYVCMIVRVCIVFVRVRAGSVYECASG